MSQCHQLSDRMPAAARGTARWSAADAAHLGGCDDCMREWQLVNRTAGLGRRLPDPDPDRIAASVLSALRRKEPSRSARVLRWALPLALAAGFLLVLVRTRGNTPAEPAAVTLSLLPEAETLSDANSEPVVVSGGEETPADAPAAEEKNEG